jgi:hypothetical protein
MAPGRQNAIIADWVGGEGMWHVDLTRMPSSIRQFEDVVGDVATDSAIEAHSSARRLAALADYLELDRGWLIRRCAEIGSTGPIPSYNRAAG